MSLLSARSPLLLVAGLLAAACGGGGSGSPTSPSTPGVPTKDETPPVLSVAFIPTDQAVAFFVFGALLPSNVQNPTFEIETTDQSSAVFAASTGKVVSITTSQNGIDRAVTMVPSDTSVWSIIYDHVSAVRVSVGQTVTAGTQLGTVGVLNNGRGRTELQVNGARLARPLKDTEINGDQNVLPTQTDPRRGHYGHTCILSGRRAGG